MREKRKRAASDAKGACTVKLIGELKEKVEAAGSRDDARQVIEGAGMQLDDEELDAIPCPTR